MTGRDQAEDRLRGPRKLGLYEDRDIDCQEALEAGLMTLVDRAEAAGWLRIETECIVGGLIVGVRGERGAAKWGRGQRILFWTRNALFHG